MKFEGRLVSGILLTLLLASMLALAYNIQPVKANGTIYIRADGSIDPPTAPISTLDNVTYTFTDNIYDSIVVERNNIIIDGRGYTLEGNGTGKGLEMRSDGRSNVTIINTRITEFFHAILIYESDLNTISNNTITNNTIGIYVLYSANNAISNNNITDNVGALGLASSIDNTVTRNNITNNDAGIWLISSHSNEIRHNIITNAIHYGIDLDYSSNNHIHQNNFINNTNQITSHGSVNVWDKGYPSGGNYWSDYSNHWSNYSHVDLHNGPYQNETGGDGIGDTPYVIDGNNRDNYPLMKPYGGHDIGITSITPSKTVVGEDYGLIITIRIRNYGSYAENLTVKVFLDSFIIGTFPDRSVASSDSLVLTLYWSTFFGKGTCTISAYVYPVLGEIFTSDNAFGGVEVNVAMGDVNSDGRVDIKDLAEAGQSFGSYPSHPRWNPDADTNEDGKVNIRDLILIAKNFGKIYL